MTSAELAALADAHGVETRYESAGREWVEVDAEVVVAVLGRLGVDASTPAAIEEALDAVRSRDADALPGTVVVREGASRDLPQPATVRLEDGGTRDVGTTVPDDLPLGYHRLVTATQDVALLVVPERAPEPPTTWGWMLQLYSLRSSESWGMGDFGDLATIARRAGREQGAGVLLVNPVDAITPVHPVQRSPYSPTSRRFANPLYLRITDVPAFAAADADTRREVLRLVPPRDTDLIEHDAVWDAKLAALELLFAHRVVDVPDEPKLTSFATFCALAEVHGGDWREWPVELQHPDSPAVEAAREELRDRVTFHAWLQVLCRLQLDAAREAAHEAGMAVGIVHDLPVGVSSGSADAWSLRDAFATDVRVGCPADPFNELGQDWGLPPWKPEALDASGHEPFRDVVRNVLAHADGIRVDHVAGLWRLWWIPPGEPAHRGTYVRYDHEAMLGILLLEARRAGAIVVGEDLGTVPDVVTETMHERGVLSSAVLWFERDWDAPGQPHVRPEDWAVEAMASITTHDLPTASGWLAAEHVRLRASLDLLDGTEADALAAAEQDRQALLDLLAAEGIATDDPVTALHEVIARAASRIVLSAPADVVGETRQPNLPGTVDEYPNWRLPLPVLLDDFFDDPRVVTAVAPLRSARPPAGQ